MQPEWKPTPPPLGPGGLMTRRAYDSGALVAMRSTIWSLVYDCVEPKATIRLNSVAHNIRQNPICMKK